VSDFPNKTNKEIKKQREHIALISNKYIQNLRHKNANEEGEDNRNLLLQIMKDTQIVEERESNAITLLEERQK
jgi:hypothetical protein